MDTLSAMLSNKLVKPDSLLPNYKCPVCPHSPTSQAGLICHLTAKHSERLVAVCKICQQGCYSCPYCRATFALPSYLQRHISRRHKVFSRPACEVCGKDFSSANALSVHKRLHQNYLPYSCQLCFANFSQKNHLKLHLDSHHAYVELDETPKPFACKTCDRGFLFTVSLQQHRLQHCKLNPKKVLPCKVCKKTFAHQSELVRHKIIHTECPPYQCPFCSRVFTRANLLKTHTLMHTNPTFLTCCYCSRAYASRSYLLRHIERHEEKMQTPSISSANSMSNLRTNILNDCRANVPRELSEVWKDPAFKDLGRDRTVFPDVGFLHSLLYGQNMG